MAGNESFDLGLGRSKRPSVTERLSEIERGAPLAGEPPKPKTIQDISIETGVPWNVIETVVGDSGVAPEQSLVFAQDFAHKMKQQIDAGQDIPSAMRSIFGDDAPIEDALERAVALAGGDQGRATSGQNNDNSTAEDIGRSFAGGAISGVGAIAEGVGTLLDVDDLFGDPGITDWAETAGRAVGDTLRGWGQDVKAGMSDDAKRAVRNSTPDGKLFEPSTWKFEGDVSPKGIALLTADVLGSLAPVVIAGIFTGGAGAAVVGGAQGAGAGAQTGREIVNKATPEQLAEHSAYYNELIAKGMTPEAAKEKVADAAGSLSALLTAPISAFGGAITGRIVNRGIGALSTKGAATRIAGTAAVAGAEEGTQEVLEGLAARTGAEVASGLPVDQMEGTFGEFVLGALGGGVVGAGRGAMPSEQPEAEGDAPLGLPAPDQQLPSPETEEPDELERPPLGVLARAAQAAPTPLPAPVPTVNAQPGQSVRVVLGNGMKVDAEFVGEDEAGVSLKVNGEPALITRDRMAADGIEIEPVDALMETAWADVETSPTTNFEPLDDTTEPLEQRTERVQTALDAYLSEQKIEATPEDRAEIANSIDRLGGTIEQAVADFQAEMQMEALAQEAAAIAPFPQPGETVDQEPVKSETPEKQGSSEVAPARNQEPVKKLDGTAWGAMTPAQREALLVSVGFADAQGNLNAPGKRAAGKGWDDLSERVREKLGERIDPQAQAEAPVAPEGVDPIALPGTRVAPDGQPAIGATAEIDEGFAANRAALGKFKNGMRVQWTDNNFDPPRTRTGTISKIDRKSGQGTVEVRADGGVNGNGWDVFIGAAQLSPEGEGAPGSVAAAATETEENPTEGQKEAENYKTGKADWQGLKLSVENRKGTERSKKTPDGAVEWSVTMPAHYGRILRTKGADGDHVDFYMGDNEDSTSVWVIDQMDADTFRFDEHKVMLGFNSATEVQETYKAGFSDGKGEDRLGGIKKMSVKDFKAWLEEGDTTKPVTEKAAQTDARYAKREADLAEGDARDKILTDAGFEWVEGSAGDYSRTKGGQTQTIRMVTSGYALLDADENVVGRSVDEAGIVEVADQALAQDGENNSFPSETPKKTGSDQPMDLERLKAIDFEEFDDQTREDGQMSPGKREARSETGRWARALVKNLKDEGFTPTLNRDGKPMKPVAFGYAMFGEPDETNIHLTAPNSVQFYAKIHKSVMSRDGGLSILVQFTGEPPKPNYSRPFLGGNRFLEPDLRPSEAAAKIADWAERALPKPKAEEPAASPKKPSWQDIDESSDNDPKMPEGYSVTGFSRLTRQQAEEMARPWPSVRAIITTSKPYSWGVYEGWSDVSRAEAIKDGLARAQRAVAKRPDSQAASNWQPTAENFPFADAEAGGAGPQARRWLESVSDDLLLEVSSRSWGLADNWLDAEQKRRKIGDYAGTTTPTPEQSADDILNAAFDDVFEDGPEAVTDVTPTVTDVTPEPTRDQFEGNETEARRQGRADFARDVPRRLPSYIDPTDAAAANGWYRGWDEANLSQDTPGVMPATPMVDLPDQDPATAWDSASDGERETVFSLGGWVIKGTRDLNEAAKRNVQRDWNDLTQAAKNKVKDAIDNGMLLGEYANAERVRRNDPQNPPRPTRTAGEAAQSAASNAAEGVSNIVDGLNALFGGANKLNSGLTFDRETYEKAKPMFIAAVRAFGRAGQDVVEMAKAMVRGLRENGLNRDAQENMRPYLTQFITDMRDGTVDPFAEEVQTPQENAISEPATPETTDEQRGNQEGDQGEPESEEPQEGMGPVGEPDGGPDDDGRGESDEDGAGADADDDAGGSVGDRPGSILDGSVDQRSGTPPANFVIIDDFALGQGTDGEKLAANMAALRLVDTLEKENRYATPEEQETLARWVGWGGLKTVFDGKHEGTTTQWGRAQAELKELLTVTEYADAMRSANDAHYTSRTVVKAMWRAMRNFGFEGGRALEPTIGSGNFLGLQPADLSENTEWFAAELDPVTGKIAKHLYPQAQVFDGTGFEDAPFRRAAFDVAIGNPPFGSTKIGNKTLHPDLGKLSVHNFIIAKTGQLLREGGVMGMVVTHRFLDAPNPEARAKIAPDFRFLGAVRLPNTAFQENAGTEVTTDIVFFQKRREGDTDSDTTWLDTGAEGPNGTKLNRYFADNPDMILGRAAMDGTMYAGGRDPNGKGEFTVHADGRDLEAALNEAIDKIEATIPTREEALEDATTARENSSTLPYGAMMLAKDGRIFRGDEDADGNRVVQEVTEETFWKDNAEAQARVVDTLRAALDGKAQGLSLTERLDLEQEARNAAQDAGLIDLAGDPISQKTKYETELSDNLLNLLVSDTPRKAALDALDTYQNMVDRKRLGTDGFARLSAMLDLRQRTRELIALERADAPEDRIEARRRGLRNAYRRFQREHGYINNAKNEAVLRGDVGPEFALEIGYKAATKDGREESATEAPILSKRVIYPHKLPDNVESVADGLHVSMQERGYIDPVMIAELTGKEPSDVLKELVSGQEPLAFKNPKTGRFEMAEVYLSGNLAEKIKDAQDAGLYQNVPHLKNAMPPPKDRDQITPSIRSLWIPPSVFTDFLQAMGYPKPKVTLLEAVGMASIEAGGTAGLTEFGKQFDTERMDAAAIFDHAVKGKIPVVYDTVREPGGSTKRVKNEPATREAVAAYERMTKEFPEWAYANPQRAGLIVDAFNEKMNVVTERQYQGVRYLRMVGDSPEISLRNSQKNGAWRMIQDKVTLLHHVVGAGKTFTAIAGVMERKRMGLSRKAVVAVPNHLTGQWGREWLELYPAANILVPTEKDFEPANRAKLINRIATGDFDAVIVGHSQLTKIENDPEATTAYIEQQITELNAALQEAKQSGESKRTVGQIGTRLNNLKTKLQDLEKKLAERADNKVLGWQDLGVDYLVVDEAHLFKNLEYTTTASQLVGMNPPGGSQRAFDMLMKVRVLQAMQNGGVSFLTGTPVSNSLVEIYAMMKYLVPDSLEAMNIQSFDAWKAAFIQDQSRFEYTASMQLKERNVMSGMINLGPLAQLYRSFADIVMRPDVERMFREQMEAKNAAEPDLAKHVPTRFPTPKVKGGARQINLAPPTEKMKEFVRYLVMRMAGIKNNKSNKEYMSTDNPLWVLTDARKASVDIRTIDPTLGREEGSKVERASDEVFRIWEANKDRKGAQMVFCDMSAPTKTAEVDAKRILKLAYEKLGLKRADITKRAADEADMTYAERWGNVIEDLENAISSPDTDEKRRDRLNEFVESEAVQDASSAMFTADTGFSFYDDMKAALIEKGVPEKEIAFIHDYNTTIKKAELFEAVNEGEVRVLIGSTQKMGAGTNAQKRLVALHHIDAPWRPSDMEQREGRIIRQKNLFYEQDPEGFEVEIIAYSTEQTADVVQWQVLERKASSIETFLNAATDSIEEEGGDADQYAEFMAQSTGKEVFLQKMQAEKDRDMEQARIASTIRNLAEAERFIAGFDFEQNRHDELIAAYEKVSFSMMGDGAEDYLAGWESEVAEYRAEKERVEAEREAVRLRNADKPRKEWEKMPELPTAPKRWEEPPTNAWERKVHDALDRAARTMSDQKIPLSDGYSVLISIQERGDTNGYRPYLVPSDDMARNAEIALIDDWQIESKDFRRSDKLLNALSPANIVSRAEYRAARRTREKDRHAQLKPEMEAIKEKGVDRGPLEAAQQRLDRLSALVRIEEVKFATETASAGPNYFAMLDDKGRDLRPDDTAKPVTGQFQFTNAGQNYASEWGAPGGTRRIEGTERSGQIVFFEAENMDTGEKVVIEAIETKKAEEGKPAEWDVLNVYDAPVEPETSADEIKASRSDVKARRADFDAAAGDVITSAPEARKEMRRVRRALRDELNAIGIGTRITLDVREGVIDTFPGIGPMDGYFLDGVIGIAADTPGGYMGVLRHEVIHALRNPQLWGNDHGLFTAQEWRTLVRAARQNTRLMDQVNADYEGLSEADKIEEVIAEMFREWMDSRETQTALGRAFDKLRQILDAIITALRGEGLNDAAAVFDRIRSGEIGGRGPEGPGGGADVTRVKAKLATPRDAGRISVQARNMRAGISQLVSDAVTNAMKDRGGYNTLALVPGRALFNELGKGIPAAKRYLRLKEKMDTKRNDKHAETDVVAQNWRKLANKNKEANAELMTLMHDSTIAGVDPSERFVSPMEPRDELIIKSGRVANPIAYEAAVERKERHERLQKAHDELSPRFEALPEAFQELYRDVRDTYRRLDDEQTAAIIGNVERAMTLAVRRAEREHRKAVDTARENYGGTLRKIGADKTLTGTERATQRAQAKMKLDQAIADADEALAKAKATRSWTKDSQVRKLRAQFETNKLSGPYFPLARFGEYFVLARDEEGNVQSFSRHETVQQQRAAQKDMEGEGFNVQIGVMQETDARDLVDPAFVADIERMLEEVNADEKLMDDIWQRWLESLPDMSIRKHRIHRKNREGYDADALRAFGHHMFHGSHQLARLLYSLEMQEELDVAAEEAAASEDPVRKGFIVNEMKRRHGFTMNPKGAWWASRATSLAFVYYLSVSPAAAIVNLSQTSIVGTSVLGRFGGTKKAAGALTKALADFTRSPRWHSERNTKHLNEDERAAMHEAYKRGVIDRTQSHDLAQVAESGVEYNAKWVRAMSIVSWLFHHSERMNREVTFLAGYRLLREQGKTHEQAITQAGDATWEVHFDYQNCVDGDTEILTTGGWKRYDQVRKGDIAISADDHGRAVETEIEDVKVFNTRQKIKLFTAKGGRNFSMAVTDEHTNMVVQQKKRGGKIVWGEPEMVKTKDLKPSHNILRSPVAPLEREGGEYGVEFARLLGWIAAEGWYAKNRGCKEKHAVRIEQSIVHNPDHVDEIENTLDTLGAQYSRHKVKEDRHILWSITGDVNQRVREAMPDKLLTWDMVAKMSAEEMSAVLDAFAKADGTKRGKNACITIEQKRSTNLQNIEVMQAMCACVGKSASIGHGGTRDTSWLMHPGTGRVQNRKTNVGLLNVERVEVPLVWCPTTGTGRWIARRGGHFFLTGNTSKPRVMQSPGMQVLLTFRNFTVNLLWRIFRDLHQAVNGADKETRKEARRQAGVMATMMLFHAGIKGVYGYGLVMALLGMFFPDDEEDPEERLEKLMLDYLPRPVARAMLDGVPGTLAGIDLTGRIGMPNLWFRDSLRPLEGADLYQHYVNEILGPIPAIGMNIATGTSRVIDGAELRDGSLIWRGVETAMPKAVRDVMKGGRYAYEGALTYNGDPIKDDFSAWEILAQVSGFTPKELVDQYDQNGRLKNKERSITNRRRNVIKQAAEQIKAGKPLTARQMRLIEEFNRDYPEWPITNATINSSVQGRIQRSERNEAGVSVNPRLEPRLRASLSPLVADG